MKLILCVSLFLAGFLVGSLVVTSRAQSTTKWRYTYVEGNGDKLARELTNDYGYWEFAGVQGNGVLLRTPA
jgi:hypothetical protein